jgi:hypothetical protein
MVVWENDANEFSTSNLNQVCKIDLICKMTSLVKKSNVVEGKRASLFGQPIRSILVEDFC